MTKVVENKSMLNILPKSDSRAKIIHIAAGVTILIGLTFAMLLRLFNDRELLTVLSLFYIPIVYVSWKLVLILARKRNITPALLPGLWFFVLGLMMLAVSIPALIIISPRETDMGYGFIIFITVAVPGVFVISTGIILLLIGIGIRVLKNWKNQQNIDIHN